MTVAGAQEQEPATIIIVATHRKAESVSGSDPDIEMQTLSYNLSVR